MQTILRYTYSNEIALDDTCLESTLHAAHKYMYPKLVEVVSNQISSKLSIENVLEIYEHVHLYEVVHLNESIVHFLQSNTLKVLKDKSFLDIQISTLEFILSQPKLLATEFELISACIEWANANKGDQLVIDTPRGVLGNLIYKIRLPCLSEKEFAVLMKIDKFFSKEEQLDILSYLSFKEQTPKGFLAKFELNARDVPQWNWVKLDLGRVGAEKSPNFDSTLVIKFKDTVYLRGIRLRYSASCGLISRRNQLTLEMSTSKILFSQKDFKLWTPEDDGNVVECMFDVPIFLSTVMHTLRLNMSCNCKHFRCHQSKTEKTRVDIRGGTAKTSFEYWSSQFPECVADISLALY